MFCQECATPIEEGRTACPACGHAVPAAPAAGRPAKVVLAVRLLVITIAISFFSMATVWIQLGFSRMATVRGAILGPLILALWTIIVALTWKGHAWARALVLMMIAWNSATVLMSLPFLFVAGVSGLGGVFSWVNFAIRLYAAYLLFQRESQVWFKTA